MLIILYGFFFSLKSTHLPSSNLIMRNWKKQVVDLGFTQWQHGQDLNLKCLNVKLMDSHAKQGW